MKNIILTIKLILLLVFAGISNVLFAADLINEGFEGSTSFPAGWTDNSAYVQNNVANAHGGTYYAGMNLERPMQKGSKLTLRDFLTPDLT